MGLWTITSVSTYQDSHLTCFPIANQLISSVITQEVNLAATLAVTHITVDVFYDYPAYMTLWVNAIRAAGKSVWFRPHWNAWNGENGETQNLNPNTYITQTQTFIQNHPTLFKSGDLFDACYEADVSNYWNTAYFSGWQTSGPNAATDAFNNFINNLDVQIQTTLQSLGITGVNTKIHGLSAFWATTQESLYPTTVQQANNTVVVDAFPEGTLTDPQLCAISWLNQINAIVAERPTVQIIIGQMGYSTIGPVTDQNQRDVIAAEMAMLANVAPLIGANYFDGPGTDFTGFSHLFKGTPGNYVLRPAAQALSDGFFARLRGWSDASALHVDIAGRTMYIDNGSFQLSDSIGARSTLQFNVDDLNGSLTFQQNQQIQVWSAGGLNLLTQNQSNLESNASGFNVVGSGVTLALSSTFAYEEANSLKVTCDGTVPNQGASCLCGTANYLPNTTYVHSAWVTGTAGTVLTIDVKRTDTSVPLAQSVRVALQGLGTWQRVAASFLTPPAGSMPVAGFGFDLEIVTSSNEVCTLYMDAFQFEQDTFPSPWHLGGTWGGTKMFGGVIADAKRNRIGYSSVYPVTIQCMDWHYCADKRIGSTTFAYQTCGQMVRSLAQQYLKAEGVTYQRGVNLLSAQNSVISGTDMTVFTTEGADVTLSQDASTGVAGVGNGFTSLKFVTDGSQTLQEVTSSAPIASFQPYQWIAWSVWIRAHVGVPTVRVFVQANDDLPGNVAIGPTTSYVIGPSFQRLSGVVQLPGSLSAGGFNWSTIGIRVDTGNAFQTLNLWMTGYQIEIVGPTTWSPGLTGGNLLSTQQADVESSNISTFTTVGTGTTTLTQDTTTAFSGNASLKIVTDGSASGQGFTTSIAESGSTPIQANSWVVLSLFMKSTTTPSIAVSSAGFSQALTQPLTASWQRYVYVFNIGASTPSSVSITVTTQSAAAATMWADGLKMEVVKAPTDFEAGGTAQSVFEGPLVLSYLVPYVTIAKALDDLAQLAGFMWFIDPNKVLWFLLPTTYTAPWTYTGAQGVYGSQTVDTAGPLYRNTQWLFNIPDVTALQTETKKGDGTTRAFTFSYPLNQAPSTITANGVAQTFGLKGVDDVNHSKQWYWALGDPVLAQEQNNTALATTDSLTMQYIGRWISAVYSQNSNAVTVQQALDGTSGIVEEAHNDPTITTTSQGFQLASALLARYGVQGQELVFDTRVAGLQIGQMLPVSMLSTPWGVISGQALIEQIYVKVAGPWFVYRVTAIIGPFNQNWVQFYQRLAQNTAAIQGAAGSSQILSILQGFSANWNWTATFNVTVLSCPIIGPATKCGPAVIVC